MVQRLDRLNNNEPHTDGRTWYQHDRDRLLHSLALRRLGGVTQVVNPNEGRFFHNRLTHTLKVAQIGRRIAERLLRDPEDARLADHLGGLNEDVVESAALAHDLGHPPFGHIGEDQLHKCVVKYNPQDGYEGNAQSFRIVTRLEVSRIDIRGLDLTCATLQALLKYPWLKPNAPHRHEIRNRKWGAYRTEHKMFDSARELRMSYDGVDEFTGMSLEAAIMDWADDIAYATHDLEDFFRAGFIPLDRLHIDSFGIEKLPREEFLDAIVKWKFPDWTNEPQERLAKVFNELMQNIPLQRYCGTRKEQGHLRGIISNLIDRYVSNTHINLRAIENPQEVRLLIPSDYLLEVKLLKALTRFYVIHNRAMMTQQHGQAKVIEELFGFYFSASVENRSSSILPTEFQNIIEEELNRNPDFSEDAIRARVVADLISSFTDDEAFKMHQRLSGLNFGSVLDHLPDNA